MNRKSLFLLFVLSALLFGGCSLLPGSDDAEDDTSTSRVNIIDLDADSTDTEEDNSADEEEPVETEPETEEPVEETAPEEEETEPEDENQPGTNKQDLAGVTAAEGARIISYEYETSGSTMTFKWGTKSNSTNPIPAAYAEIDSDGDLVVVFTSLQLDSVTDGVEAETPLGSRLPTLKWGPMGSGSKYEFKFGAAKTFVLSSDSEAKQVILTVTL